VAAADGRLLAFPVRAFREALEGDAAFRDAWMAQLAREVRKLRARCERLSLHGAEARILHAIESEGTAGTLVLAQSRKAWAAELGLTHEALYRTLARLQAAGTLAVDGGRLTLRQPGRRL
jgi:CRP-like cAMP-binding protein